MIIIDKNWCFQKDVCPFFLWIQCIAINMFIFPHIETSNCVFDSWLQTVILISKLDFYSVRASPASVSQLICTHQFSAASICKLVGNPIDYCVLNYWIFFIFTKHNRLRFVYSARSNIQGSGHSIYLMMNMEMKLRCNSFGTCWRKWYSFDRRTKPGK